MINYITVNSFQSHDSTEIVFTPGVNVLTGQSQSGKTAVLRALNWIVANRPLGDSFIKEGKQIVSAGLEITNNSGTTIGIVREKTKKGDNRYEVLKDGEEPLVITTFGSDVPPQISEVLNFSDINIQDQLAPYFLVLESPGQVAQYIRKIAKLSDVDNVVSNISSKLKGLGIEKKNTVLQIEETRARLNILDQIDLALLEKNIKLVENLSSEQNAIEIEVTDLEALLFEITSVNTEFSKYERISFTDLEKDTNKLRVYIDVYSKDDREIRDLTTFVTELESIVEITLPDNIDKILVSLQNSISARLSEEDDFSELDEYISNLSTFDIDLSSTVKDSEVFVAEVYELRKKITVCPLCEQDLNSEAQEVFLSNVSSRMLR